MNRSITAASNLIIAVVIGYLLIIGRGILVPIVIAIFVWNILNSIQQLIAQTPIVGRHLSNYLTMFLSFFVVGICIAIVVNILENNLDQVMNASSRYHANFNRMIAKIDQKSTLKVVQGLESFFKELDFQDILVRFYSVFTSLASSAVLIALYVAFLFIEQGEFPKKIANLFPKEESKALVLHLLDKIAKDTQTYLGLKTLLGFITSLFSWFIMIYVGLDFAAFWALLIFLLNYIPNIGAIIATLFPALLGLVQFQDWWLVVMMVSGLVLVQFVIGNIIEPRFLSRSLNLSSLVILIALALWGSIWGVLGMFLSVPITVMMMIIFSQFSSTRPIAILLSQNGLIQETYKKR